MKSKQTLEKVKHRRVDINSIIRPRLTCKIKVNSNSIVLYQSDRTLDGLSGSLTYQASSQLSDSLPRLFSLMDGTRTVEKLQQIFAINNPQIINKIISDLEEHNLINDATQPEINSGSDALEELEYLTKKLLTSSSKNNLWQQSINLKSQLPVNVLYGFALEQYQICSRKSTVFAPALSYYGTDQIQKLIDRLYRQEVAREELLLEALNTICINNRQLSETVPLPETAAICHSLAYWANSEPLFFFYAIATIKQRAAQNWQAYLEVCELTKIETQFLAPIRKLTQLNYEDWHQSLIHYLFEEVPHLEKKTKQRFAGQIYLLIEMYNNFQSAIWNYYSSGDWLHSVSLT